MNDNVYRIISAYQYISNKSIKTKRAVTLNELPLEVVVAAGDEEEVVVDAEEVVGPMISEK